jgi:hypothetical protein
LISLLVSSSGFGGGKGFFSFSPAFLFVCLFSWSLILSQKVIIRLLSYSLWHFKALFGSDCLILDGLVFIFIQRNNKKKTKLVRAGSACPKDYGIMFCSITRKPPFGTYSVSFWPVCIPSFKTAFFFFFPFFCFLWKNIFFLDCCTGSIMSVGFCWDISAKV